MADFKNYVVNITQQSPNRHLGHVRLQGKLKLNKKNSTYSEVLIWFFKMSMYQSPDDFSDRFWLRRVSHKTLLSLCLKTYFLISLGRGWRLQPGSPAPFWYPNDIPSPDGIINLITENNTEESSSMAFILLFHILQKHLYNKIFTFSPKMLVYCT